MAPLVWARNTTKTATKNRGVSTVLVSRARRAGEHRPPAECPATLPREVAHAVRDKLPRITGQRAVLPSKTNRCFIAGLIFLAASLHPTPALRCRFCSSRFYCLIRNQVLPLNSHKRVPGGRERRCANRSRSIEWSASGLHRTRPAERRAVFPIRQRNCLWPSLAPRPPSARFLSRFRVRARLVEDRKIHW